MTTREYAKGLSTCWRRRVSQPSARATDSRRCNFLAESARKPALILLDLMMPILDGWTFCKVRQGVAMLMDIPVVAISAAPMNGKHEPLRVEATLAKPFDPDALAWLATRMAKRKSFVPPRH